METIREGRIIIHLEQGKVELKAPQLDALTKTRQNETAATARLAAEQEKLNNVWGEYGKHLDTAHKHQMRALGSMAELGEGFFRIGRAAILLGASSEDSFAKMIRGLATVQAYFDIFKGSIQIVRNLSQVSEALAKAQQAVNAAYAIAAAQGFGELFSKAVVWATALVRALNPITIILGLIAAAVAAAAAAWDYLTVSTAEQAEAQKQATEAAERYLALVRQQIDAEQELADIRRSLMSDAERADSLGSAASRIGTLAGRSANIRNNPGTPGVDAQYLELNNEMSRQVVRDLQEEIQLRKQIRDEAIREAQEKIRAVEAQERLVESARRQLDIEQQKIRSFQAQVGALSAIEQQQLKDIRDKLRAGQGINALEEDFLANSGGEQGRGIVENIRAKRGAAAGFDENFFAGIEGAGTGLKDAAKALEEAVAALNKLTDGSTAAEAKTRMEETIKAANESFDKFFAEKKKEIEQLVAIMQLNNEELAKIRERLENGS